MASRLDKEIRNLGSKKLKKAESPRPTCRLFSGRGHVGGAVEDKLWHKQGDRVKMRRRRKGKCDIMWMGVQIEQWASAHHMIFVLVSRSRWAVKPLKPLSCRNLFFTYTRVTPRRLKTQELWRLHLGIAAGWWFRLPKTSKLPHRVQTFGVPRAPICLGSLDS